jgi:hypothetical protein
MAVLGYPLGLISPEQVRARRGQPTNAYFLNNRLKFTIAYNQQEDDSGARGIFIPLALPVRFQTTNAPSPRLLSAMQTPLT